MKLQTLPASAGIALLVLAGAAIAQSEGEPDEFAPENAILDTSIPFAIGAREARQELRGAFGWSTFQEGLVEGVYFRFDPDGYARFAPTPRLDSDVFEVICRPRTLTCMGRKGPLQVFMTGDGAMQLQFDDILETDNLFMVEGLSELPLPETVLMPLDARFETLLSTGGELLIRRGEAETSRVSLTGFAAVVAYLRWITAQQDYAVLPRGWPVPNSSNLTAGSGLTQPQEWQAPVRNAQNQPVFERELTAGDQQVASEVAGVRGELSALRALLLSGESGAAEETAAAQAVPANAPAAASHQDTQTQNQIAALQATAQSLLAAIAQLQGGGVSVETGASGTSPAPATASVTAAQAPVPTPAPAAPNTSGYGGDPEAMGFGQTIFNGPTNAGLQGPSGGEVNPGRKPDRLAAQLDYLITEIGLDPETALLLLRSEGVGDFSDAAGIKDSGEVDPVLSEGDMIVSEIIREIRDQLPNENAMAASGMAQQAITAVPPDDFVLLTDYFRSVFGASHR